MRAYVYDVVVLCLCVGGVGAGEWGARGRAARQRRSSCHRHLRHSVGGDGPQGGGAPAAGVGGSACRHGRGATAAGADPSPLHHRRACWARWASASWLAGKPRAARRWLAARVRPRSRALPLPTAPAAQREAAADVSGRGAAAPALWQGPQRRQRGREHGRGPGRAAALAVTSVRPRRCSRSRQGHGWLPAGPAQRAQRPDSCRSPPAGPEARPASV